MPKRILFLHPDLGIGGAERLVVDAALALSTTGHSVEFVTTHHDLTHCFAETKDGSFPVTVVGDWIPRSIFGRFYALCAYIRMIYAALYIILFSHLNPDIIFCDIVSVCIPILKFCGAHIIFYCHFPDQLLSTPGGKLKTLYRAPLNWLEEKTTCSANTILVNSRFTQNIFKQTFTTIQRTPEILYPSINTKSFDNTDTSSHEELELNLPPNRFLFLSINRYERKKNISLALNALSLLEQKLDRNIWSTVQLVIAGGYDNRVSENIEYFDELKNLSKLLKVVDKVHFLRSPSDKTKITLLRQCDCLLYTPSNEHFGIVPLEAMYSQKSVIAVNSGGPTETIVKEENGYLCNPDPESFSSAMEKYVKDPSLAIKMGNIGRKRFEDNFSFNAFKDRLNGIIENIDNPGKSE